MHLPLSSFLSVLLRRRLDRLHTNERLSLDLQTMVESEDKFTYEFRSESLFDSLCDTCCQI